MRALPMILKPKDRNWLRQLTKKGKRQSIRVVNRARSLLLLHQGKRETAIAEYLGIERKTVWRTKKRYVNEGLEAALSERPRSGQPRKYTERDQAVLVAVACTNAPEGRKRWTVRLLMERMRSDEGCPTMNRETVRLVLKKTKQNLG